MATIPANLGGANLDNSECLDVEYVLSQPFSIELFKKAYYLDLEVMIAPDGTVEYALPSHQEFLVNKAMELQGWTRDELWAACPPEYHYNVLEWLIPLAGGYIPVWPQGILEYPLTKKQVASLRKLKLAGLYRGYIPKPTHPLPTTQE